MSIRIFEDALAGQIFVARGTIGTWPYNSLHAIGNGDGTLNIRNKAKAYSDDSVFYEISNVNYDQFVDESDSAWGANEAETVQNLNNLFVNVGSQGFVPVYTAATTIEVTDGDTLNYFATADYGVGWEWSSLPSGIVVNNNNPRNIIGQFSSGVGSYNADVIAVNYYGSTTTTLTFNVSSPPYNNTISTFFENRDYGALTANTSNPMYRPGNGTGASDAWSISFWIKPSSINSSNQTILFFGGDDRNNESGVEIKFVGSSDKLRLLYGSNNNNLELDTPTNSLPANTWKHVLITYDGGTTGVASGSISDYYGRFEIWINGVSQSLTTSNSNYGTSQSVPADVFTVGELGTNGSHLRNVFLDEIAIWSTDETANAAVIYNGGAAHDLTLLGSSPVHYWRMGDGDTFPTIQDVVGSIDMALVNMTVANFTNDVP